MGKKVESHFFPNFSLSHFHSVIKKKNDENKFEEHRMTNLKINRIEKYMRKGNAINKYYVCLWKQKYRILHDRANENHV